MNLESTRAFFDEYSRHELRRWDGSTGALGWTEDFICRHYAPGTIGDKAFISISMSIESLILGDAVQGELAFKGRIPHDLAEEVAKRALTERDCSVMARGLVVQAAKECWRLPEPLHGFAASVVDGAKYPTKQGEAFWKIRTRNLVGAAALGVLTNKSNGFALSATPRVGRTNLPSACELLVKATSGQGWAAITPSSADEIWRRRNRLWAEWHVIHEIGGMHKEGKRLNARGAFKLLRHLDRLGLPAPSGRKRKK